MRTKKPAPSTMIIFGATGDLTKRKLLPALYRLQSLNLLPDIFNIVGFSTRPLSDGDFRGLAAEAIKEFSRQRPINDETQRKLTDNAFFISSSFDDEAGFRKLAERLSGIDKRCGTPCERLFYLATPPSFFTTIVEMLSISGVSAGKGDGGRWAKLIIEKPFGTDLDSARKLNSLILKYFDEEQVYRIDHYLGKETVQNMLFFRFANGIYEPIWNRRYIDHIQITAAETIGVENRGKYFEEAGTLRDMMQNHILQLLSLVAMEPPINMDADVIRAKKMELLRSIRHIEPEEADRYTVRGQYGHGVVEGRLAVVYRQEKGVLPTSTTETYVALRVMIDNWRWAGVPFYLRTGKRLKKDLTEIAVHFKQIPHSLFTKTMAGHPESNVLVLKIQPDEGIAFQFNVKRPGSTNHMESVTMDFSYKDAFQAELPEAYER
ncbi:MAG: glucose-6-phosphate dehydrogenase, partial [Deltaproteobacteria bacterium]|nr:glucose-6-phosphate dehydrogenase [Deltaproteobacteria bacterium]